MEKIVLLMMLSMGNTQSNDLLREKTEQPILDKKECQHSLHFHDYAHTFLQKIAAMKKCSNQWKGNATGLETAHIGLTAAADLLRPKKIPEEQNLDRRRTGLLALAVEIVRKLYGSDDVYRFAQVRKTQASTTYIHSRQLD